MKLPILKIFFILILSLTGLNKSYPQAKYHNYDEMTKEIFSLVSANKEISKVTSLIKSGGGRDLWCVTVGGRDADKNHAILIVGGMEADRLIGSELALNYLNHLIMNYGKVDSVTKLLNSTTYYVIPRIDPDASEQFFLKPSYQRTVNSTPIDDDKDGQMDEDGYEDLDGDGMITTIRVKDSQGEWMPHPDQAKIMKKADRSKGEAGSYKMFTEGIDNDGDEEWNEDPQGGVNLNRNFPHNFQYFSKGSGPYQLSEGAARSLADFCFSHPNISMVFTFSASENLISPWKKEQSWQSAQGEERSGRRGRSGDEEYSPELITSVLGEDEQYFSFFGKQYQEITRLKKAPASVKGEGSFNEWAYYHFGRWSLSADPWWIPELEPKKDTSMRDSTSLNKGFERKMDPKGDKPDEYSSQINALKWFEANGMADRFIGWRTIKHKDFPNKEVEVGGFRPFSLNNPPEDSILSIAGKVNSFLAWLGTKLPAIELKNISVKPVGNKIFRVTASVVNNGFLPTNSAIGVKSGWPRDVKVSLALNKNQKLAAGKMVEIVPPIIGSGGYKEITWLIVSQQGEEITITAESPTAGSSTQKIFLK